MNKQQVLTFCQGWLKSWTGNKPPYGYVDWWPHSMYVNCEKAPWSDKNVRWALSSYIDRQKIVDVAWSGASKVTPLPLPDYLPLKPYFAAVADLLKKYDTLEYNPAKGDALLTAKGWKKNAAGMWMDEKGQPVKLDLQSFFDFTSVGPVVVEMLKRGGIDSSYSEPPSFFDDFSVGKFNGALFGHGGSCREPQETLALYQSISEAIPGGHAVNFSRWKNPEFDKLADAAIVTAPTDTKKLIDIWVKAMEIWLPELPDILEQTYAPRYKRDQTGTMVLDAIDLVTPWDCGYCDYHLTKKERRINPASGRMKIYGWTQPDSVCKPHNAPPVQVASWSGGKLQNVRPGHEDAIVEWMKTKVTSYVEEEEE